MTSTPYRNALIVGAGPGIGAALARCLRAAGLEVAVAARDIAKLAPLVHETGAVALPVDAAARRLHAARGLLHDVEGPERGDGDGLRDALRVEFRERPAQPAARVVDHHLLVLKPASTAGQRYRPLRLALSPS